MSEEPQGLRRIATMADRRRIAIIGLRGVIGGAVKTGDLIRTLGQARRNKNVRAVVLEIDSPGGAAAESEALYLAVRKVAADKPVVAWIRSTGASGAYFAACGATRILAFPSAVVGSIGVISVRPVAVEAIRRLGTSVQVTKTGPFKDLGAPWREPTEEDLVKERALVDAIFRRFTGAVAGARGFDDARMRQVTSGEVWLGEEAASLGLVDDLCDDEEGAVRQAQQLAGLPHRRVVRMGPRRSLLQRAGLPGAGMGPPGPRWIAELEGWLRAPRVRL
ncbi:MAG TPA: signal peptide peptidase SppA [Candidatus Binatia bacterium]|nr:signal peptide peptidase SppA [Candidatus Binatia bacterium]